jgi:hypothetical protein
MKKKPIQNRPLGEIMAGVGVSFTRPADTTAYASGDLVANSVTAGSVVPLTIQMARTINLPTVINRVRLLKSGTSVTNASFRVHFYRDTPTVTNGDNGAWLSTHSHYIGSVDVTVDKAFSDGAKGTSAGYLGLIVEPSGSASIYCLLEARAAYTPTSAEVFTVTLESSTVL